MNAKITTKRKNSGWSKELLERLKNIQSHEAAVGFPAGKDLDVPHYTSKRADGSTVAGPSILEAAIFNNFGTKDIPSRPFMDKATPAIAAAWKQQKADIIRKINRGEEAEAMKELNAAGEAAKTIIVLEIDAMTSPANAKSTVKRKGSSHPLIDTGAMKGAVTHVVRPRGGEGESA